MKAKLLFILSFLVTITATSQVHDETQDGDLSNAFDSPSGPFTLDVGDNVFTAAQGGNSNDVDYFTIVLPPDLQLDQLFLDGYTAEGTNNSAFMGIQEGAAFTTDASSTTASDLLGGITYGSGNLDTDMLPAIGTLGQGFTPPLPTGTYTIWLNQTGPMSEATLRFVVSGTLGINDQVIANDVQLFPNPVKDVLTVSSTTVVVNDLAIYDITGKLILKETFPQEVSLQFLTAGVYFAQFTTDQGNVTKKIIKL